MERINTQNAVPDMFGQGKAGLRDGNKAQGIPATELNASFFNHIQEEIAGVIEKAGIALDSNNNKQLLQALCELFSPIDAISLPEGGAPDMVLTKKSAADGDIEWRYISVIPVSTIIALASNTTPEGYLYCNGAAVSRTVYAALFAAIGVIYGVGDGSTTFNLPNYRSRVMQGADTVGTAFAAGLPNIYGSFGDCAYAPDYGDNGPFVRGALKQYGGLVNNSNNAAWTFNAALANPIYGASGTVQPPALTARFCIKY